MAVSPPLDPDNRTWEAAVAATLMCAMWAVAAYRIRPQRRLLKGLAYQLVKGLCPGRAQKDAGLSPVDRRIREECERRHLQRADLLLVLSLLGGVGQTMFLLLNVLTSDPVLNLGQLLLWYGAILVPNTLVSLCPRAITRWTVDALYCLNMLGLVGFTLLHDLENCRIQEHRASTMAHVLYLGLFNLKPWLNGLGVFAIASAETFMLVVTGHACLCVWASYATVLFVLLGMHHILTNAVRLEILGANSDNELTAAKALLDSICDVIVQLDAGLRMKQHSPKLADVLLHSPGKNFEGADLRDLMLRDEDREVFTRYMAAPAKEGPAHAAAFHARMRDCNGTPLSMEFFSVTFVGQDATPQHYLGMREYTDTAPVVPPQREPPPAVEVELPAVRPPAPCEGTPAVLEMGDLRSHSGSTCSGSRPGRGGAGGAEKPSLIETKDVAKLVSINYMLTGWSVAKKRGDCCPWHAALEDLQSSLPRIIAMKTPCSKRFGPETKWQCPTCGIRAKEYRSTKWRSRCHLCESATDEQLNGGSSRTLASAGDGLGSMAL